MLILLAASAGVLGLLIGSFLNVVVWRVPRNESIARPPSACPTCHQPVRPRDNVPVLSWVLLRGRCRDCGAPIGARYPLVEAGTGVAFAATAAWFGAVWHLPAYLYLVAIAIALALIDIDVHRLPNAIVLPSYVVGGVLLLVGSAGSGEWGRMIGAGTGMAALYALYFLLAFIYPSGMGFGDVKLAGVLGLYLGWLGYAELVVGGFAGFLLGGVGGAFLMAFRGAGRKSKIPFGPFMLLGALVGIVVGGTVADWYLGVVGL